MFLETDHSDHRCCWSLMIYGSSESSGCFSTPPTRRRLPVTSTEMWPASQPDREPNGPAGAAQVLLSGWSTGGRWGCRGTLGCDSMKCPPEGGGADFLFLLHSGSAICSGCLCSQPACAAHTFTHTDAVVSYRETAAQEKHSHVNVMYKIFSNGGENKHNTTLFELVASTSTLI